MTSTTVGFLPIQSNKKRVSALETNETALDNTILWLNRKSYQIRIKCVSKTSAFLGLRES